MNMVGRKLHLTFITQLKTTNMNFEITTLAETMNAAGFIIELNERNIDYVVKDMSDISNANEGECIVSIEDMDYVFSDGELYDVLLGVM
jgi:hypothetical protein